MLPFPTSSDCAVDRRAGVLHWRGILRVIALDSFADGEVVFPLEGVVRSAPSRYSIQIGWNEHLEAPPDTAWEEVLHQYPWRFLNHQCRPNARIDGRNLRAVGMIRRWEEITFDYETTEWRMAEPFECCCDACGGRWIRGFEALSLGERRRRAPFLAPHLRARLAHGLRD